MADKRAAFRRLHESGCVVTQNPRGIGSARLLQGMGFEALATTSAGFARSRGRSDNDVSRDMALAHLAEMVEATDLPINADFENGFAADAAGVAQAARRAIDAAGGEHCREQFVEPLRRELGRTGALGRA